MKAIYKSLNPLQIGSCCNELVLTLDSKKDVSLNPLQIGSCCNTAPQTEKDRLIGLNPLQIGSCCNKRLIKDKKGNFQSQSPSNRVML